MYLLYPLLHRWLYLDNCLKKKRLFVASLLSITIPVFIKISFPSYYALIDVGVQKIPLLILGSATMFVISRKSSSYAELLIVVLCILMFSFVERSAFYMIVNFLSIIILSLFFCFCDKHRILRTILVVFRWLGKYTLELYIIHLLFYYFLEVVLPSMSGLNIWLSVVAALSTCKPLHWLINRLQILVLAKL